MNFSVLGIDLAKNSFSLYVLDRDGTCLSKRTVRRRQLITTVQRFSVDKIAMEACASAHYWARQFSQLGYTVVLLPAQHVKGYLRGQKNDGNDAQAIAEAAQHGRIRPVRIKTVADQDRQSFLRIRQRLAADQTQLVNQIRGLLAEYGVVIAKGIASFRSAVPLILEDAENGLSAYFRTLLHRRYQQFLTLAEERAWYDQQLQNAAQQDETCQRLQAVPGIGPVVAYHLKDWMGDGQQFQRGRDASAALGVVPRQNSTGGRNTLLGISKRGNRHLRSILIHGARAVVSQALRQAKVDCLSRWLRRLVERRGFNKAVVALANKTVRVAWVLIARGQTYQAAQ